MDLTGLIVSGNSTWAVGTGYLVEFSKPFFVCILTMIVDLLIVGVNTALM